MARTPKELERDFSQVNRELAEFAAGKVLPGNVDRAEREAELLRRLDEIEYEAGMYYHDQPKRKGL